jgi:hypothetical protein
MPIYYGNSYEIQVGFRDVYRKGRSSFAAGSYINLSFDSYKLDKAYLHNPLVVSYDIGTIHKEYYRSSNFTAGLFARFYLNEALFLDLGPYGEYAYNKKYKVFITLLGDSGESKIKYRDGRRFNPFNAGLQCSLGFNGFSVYAKYRITNCFNHDNIELEVPRLNIGIQFEIYPIASTKIDFLRYQFHSVSLFKIFKIHEELVVEIVVVFNCRIVIEITLYPWVSS